MNSTKNTDQLDFRFKNMPSLFTQVGKMEEAKEDRSMLDEKCCIILFANGNLTRIRKTLPQFERLSVCTILIDDTGLDCVNKFVTQENKKSNIIYHGLREQTRIFETIKTITNQATRFFCPFGQKYWTLGYCRNYALFLAKLWGFERILMIDDDIIIDGFKQVIRIFGLLRQFNIVGAKTVGMADDSVVGHTIRTFGLEHDEFISGQFAGIDVNSVYYYFPNMYNEDWIFFLLQSVNTSLARYSEVRQLAFDPFNNARQKSLFQEFGEIAVDGVFDAVVCKRNADLLTNQEFWINICSERVKLLEDLRKTFKSSSKGRTFEKIFQTLQEYHLSLDPSQFSIFFEKYFDSLAEWHRLLNDLPEYQGEQN